jgi:hypothetical protein
MIDLDEELIGAIDKNDTVTASSLISSGSVNLNGKLWPLHHAAERGRVESMSMLLDAGADIMPLTDFDILRVISQLSRISLMRSNCLLSVMQISASSIQEAARCSRLRHNLKEKSDLSFYCLTPVRRSMVCRNSS